AEGHDDKELLRLGASVERVSEHPLALAIVAAAEKQGLPLAAVSDFDSPTGKGAQGVVDGKPILLGNAAFLKEEGVDATVLAARADTLRHDGATAIFIAVDGVAAGIFAIADPVKETTQQAISALR